MRYVAYDEKVSAQAGSWLARLHACDLSAYDEAAFHEWLASDPAHRAAFEEATNIWERLGAIPRKDFLPEKKPPLFSRRVLVTGAAGIVATVASAPFVGEQADAQIYQTAVGEQKRVSLPDGTAVLMDTSTKIAVQLTPDICLVHLQYGRVNCSVAQNQRQFAIKAAERLLIGNRTIFDLSYIQQCFTVVLIQGHAVVSSMAGPVGLDEGERVTALAAAPLKRDRPQLSSLIAWQTGHLIFKYETIADAADEMNRYSAVKMRIDDPQLAGLRISGGYLAGDNEGFAASLAHLYPIEVHRIGDAIWLTRTSPV